MRKPKGYWNIKENTFAEAKKYHTRDEFRKYCNVVYNVARKNGWLDEMYWFRRPTVHNKKWYRETVFEEARKYKTKKEFQKGCISAYSAAIKNGWIVEMDWFVDGRVKLFTDKIDCVYRYFFKETKSIYIGRSIQPKMRHWQHLFRENDTLYKYAKENSLEVPQMEIIEDNLTIEEGQKREDYWIEYYKEMGYKVLNVAKAGSIGAISNGKWSKENVFIESKKYRTKYDFERSCNRAYTLALKNGWLKEMTWLAATQKPNGYWNIKNNVFAEARKYTTRKSFQIGCGSAYHSARKKRWLDEMDWLIVVEKPKGYWNIKDNVFAEARKYQRKVDFQRGCSRAYQTARKNKWLDELFPKKCAA